MTKITFTLHICGNTYACKEALKKYGFTYVPRFYDFNKGENVKAFWYKDELTAEDVDFYTEVFESEDRWTKVFSNVNPYAVLH